MNVLGTTYNEDTVLVLRSGVDFAYYKNIKGDVHTFNILIENDEGSKLMSFEITRKNDGRAVGKNLPHSRDIMTLGS